VLRQRTEAYGRVDNGRVRTGRSRVGPRIGKREVTGGPKRIEAKVLRKLRKGQGNFRIRRSALVNTVQSKVHGLALPEPCAGALGTRSARVTLA